MSDSTGGAASASSIALELDPALRGSLTRRADGRLLVIDSFRSVGCGGAIGDITIRWWREPPVGDFVEIAPFEGVSLFVRRSLVRLLAAARPTLTRARLPFQGGLSISLGRPELWIDFLDSPGRWQGAGPVTASPDVPAAARAAIVPATDQDNAVERGRPAGLG